MAKFQKGSSGNPGGRPKEVGELRVLARERTTKALETLVQVMEDSEAPASARVAAACAVLDRGHGRPKQEMAIEPIEATIATKAVDPEMVARKYAYIMARALKNKELRNHSEQA